MHTLKPDLAVIDMALPDIVGSEVCQRIRQMVDRMLPILLVSSSDRVADKVSGLESGADDYITRPFDLEEFAARIRAGLRHVENAPAHALKIELEDLVIETTTKQVWRSGEPVSLTPREYELLELLALNAGRVLTKGCIFERVWGGESEAGWEVIKVYVNYLRTKLNVEGKPDLIHSVRGVGYMLKPWRCFGGINECTAKRDTSAMDWKLPSSARQRTRRGCPRRDDQAACHRKWANPA